MPISPTPTPPPDPCVHPLDPLAVPPDFDKQRLRRWYGIGKTSTTRADSWLGATVEWQNERMFVPRGVPDVFIAQVLWVTAQNSHNCFIEVGDGQSNDSNGMENRSYYWAENDATGWHERLMLTHPPYPNWDVYRRYRIAKAVGPRYYRVYINAYWVGVSPQPGDTLWAETGVESNDVRTGLDPTKFRLFFVLSNEGQWLPWPTQIPDAEPPAKWQWSWPTATNGFN